MHPLAHTRFSTDRLTPAHRISGIPTVSLLRPPNASARELVSSFAPYRRPATVRYPDGESPDARYPEGELMSEMLTFSMYLSIVIGIVLLVIGWRGRSIWLSFWSAGLILCSVAYLVGNAMGWFYA